MDRRKISDDDGGGERMNESLISVIMPTYNRGYMIKDAINSVINQTYKNWELIIVDDGSYDNTEDIIKSIHDSRIIYIKNKTQKGANYARNVGSENAKGIFLAFLDSDNYWEPNMLETLAKDLHQKPDAALSFCKVEAQKGEKYEVPAQDLCMDRLREYLCYKNAIDTNTVLIKKSIFEKVGLFDPAMPRMQDWELFFRIIVVNNYPASYIPEVLVHNIVQADSISYSDEKYVEAGILFLEKHYRCLDAKSVAERLYRIFEKKEKEIDKERMVSLAKNCESEFGYQFVYELLEIMSFQSKMYETLMKWKVEEYGRKKFADYCCKWKEKKIAIYGLGKWGELIYQELISQQIKISYGLDSLKTTFHDIPVYDLNAMPDDIDVIIISLFLGYKEVYRQLKRNFNGEVVVITDIMGIQTS